MPGNSPHRPRLSVVIPSHDTRGLTLQCLESIRAQGEMVEVLVVDDASADGTAEAVSERHPEARVVRQSQRQGFTRSVNRGLAEAAGEILIALNSDTEVLPGSLAAVVARFDADARVGVVGARLHFPDGRPQWSGGAEPSLTWLFALASGLPGLLARLPSWRRLRRPAGTGRQPSVDWVTGAALAMRRRVWETVGPFDEEYRFYAQDLDLCLRARSRGWQVEIVPAFRVLHHHGATIGRGTAAVARQNPALLWADLVLWATSHRGRSWGRRAALALRLGGRLRLFGRRLREVSLPAESRAAWRRDTLAYRQALTAVSRAAPLPKPTDRSVTRR